MILFVTLLGGLLRVIFDILSNKIVYPSLITTAAAQTLKLLIDLYRNKKLTGKVLFSMGGMPSSHSASVAALVTSLARYEPKGVASLAFGSSLVFAFIVMYDAAGIRRSAGQQAVIINKVVQRLEDEHGKVILKSSLVEVLGHTPMEVFMGAVFGFLISWFICYVLDPIG